MSGALRRGGAEGVLCGSTAAHKKLRHRFVKNNTVEGVLSLPGGVFNPYSDVKTGEMRYAGVPSRGDDVIHPNPKSIGQLAKSVHRPAVASRLNLDDLHSVDAAGAREGGLRQPTVLAPDP